MKIRFALTYCLKKHFSLACRQSSVALNLQPKESKEDNERVNSSKIRKTNESNLLDAVRKEIAEAKGIELGTSSASAGGSTNNSNDIKMSEGAASGVEAMEVEASSSEQRPLEKKSNIADEENEDGDAGEIHIVRLFFSTNFLRIQSITR